MVVKVEHIASILKHIDEQASYKRYIPLLHACKEDRALREGRQLHEHLVRNGLVTNPFLAQNLISMYATCGSLEDAKAVFDGLQERDLVTWTTMLTAYAQFGHRQKAVELLSQMHQAKVTPDNVIYVVLLSAFSTPEAAEDGRSVHAAVSSAGMEQDVLVSNALLKMYGSYGSASEALTVFGKMQEKNVVSWTSIIRVLVRDGQPRAALDLVHHMQLEGTRADKITFATILTACGFDGSYRGLRQGRCVHGWVVESGLEMNQVVRTALINMYGRCRCLESARELLHRLDQRNVIAWTTTLEAFSQQGRGREALALFQRMQLEGIRADATALTAAANACSGVGSLRLAKLVHGFIAEAEVPENDVKVDNVLIDMYAKCSSLESARKIFDDMEKRDKVSWNSIISAYVQRQDHVGALELFKRMDVEPDTVTYVAALNACAGLGDLKQGQEVHRRMRKLGLLENCDGVSTALVNMYGKCGDTETAAKIFRLMKLRGVVTWTVLIRAYSEHGDNVSAVGLFWRMQLAGVRPNKVTFVSVLEACADLGDVKVGKRLHRLVAENGLESEAGVGNALMNMFSKCGELQAAVSVFWKLCRRDVITWNTLMGSLAQHGHGDTCKELFQLMQLTGEEPNSVTFINLLNASSHAGLVQDACTCFISMQLDYGVSPKEEHYGCLIDLLGRKGELGLSEEIINGEHEENVVVWTAFLAACRNQGDVQRANRAAERVSELNPSSNYACSALTVLSNVIAAP